ncbi:SSI family serine proteinase inhibitor [Streptomyces sp. NRRL B-24085]|uniref:SSI family serine proteinase inhibitor n=1 Tax=Streptomyces sp. NRRL B-24085 TaxID=1709476 RepID=UPI0006B34053|nr:SSI family serine proteinase inhibitor [Streptomyces sp. NRRL B-24085]
MSYVIRPGRLARLSPLPLFLAALAPTPATAYTPTGDHLTVTVRDAGHGADGTFEVDCHPARGTHPDPAGACAGLDRNTRWGRDTFAPVPEGSVCTMLYGGPATAHVTGTWAGRPVDARFDRSNGCETARWDRFVPLLPGMDT